MDFFFFFFWQEALWPLPDQLASGVCSCSGAAEATAGVGVDICSDDSLPAPFQYLPTPVTLESRLLQVPQSGVGIQNQLLVLSVPPFVGRVRVGAEGPCPAHLVRSMTNVVFRSFRSNVGRCNCSRQLSQRCVRYCVWGVGSCVWDMLFAPSPWLIDSIL